MIRRVVLLKPPAPPQIVGLIDREAKDVPEEIDGYSLVAIRETYVSYQEAACISSSPSLVIPHIFMGQS